MCRRRRVYVKCIKEKHFEHLQISGHSKNGPHRSCWRNRWIGRHIVEAILKKKKHHVRVLSRAPSNPSLESMGAEVVAIDYGDQKSLVAALQGVHTVISTIASFEADQMVTSQIALLNAAADTGVKRFAPSEFAILAEHDDPMVIYRSKPPVMDAVIKSGLHQESWHKVCSLYIDSSCHIFRIFNTLRPHIYLS